jgi:prepilin-type N-terminal cleavage/methylation domain-containing protein
MRGRPTQPDAFTLLELLVAMVLMVVTAACLYTALYTGFRAQRTAARAVEPTLKAINVIELLKQDIFGVLAPTGTLAGAFVGTDAGGIKGVDADYLEFYTTRVHAEDDEVAGGLGKIELTLEEDVDSDDGTYKLLRRVTTNLLSPRTIDPVEQVLGRQIVSLNLRYYDVDGGWLDEWDSTADANSLPHAVEIDIQVAHAANGSVDEAETRRLVQCFPIPCGAWVAAETETEGETATEGGGSVPR